MLQALALARTAGLDVDIPGGRIGLTDWLAVNGSHDLCPFTNGSCHAFDGPLLVSGQ